MSGRGFFSRMFGGEGVVEDETRVFSAEEVGRRRSGREDAEEEWRMQGFNVERAAEIIDDLPPDVPRESAVRIVRGTLTAAGVRVENLERSTRVRESKFHSEIELAQNRQRELREKTDEVVRSLEDEIRKARAACNAGIAEEERKVSRALSGIESVSRVRAFFGFPEIEEKSVEPGEVPSGDETQVLEPLNEDETQVLQRPDSLSGADRPAAADTTSEGPLPRRNPQDTPTDER